MVLEKVERERGKTLKALLSGTARNTNSMAV